LPPLSKWSIQLFWVNCSLARVFSDQGKFEDAQTHIEHAKSHAANDAYLLAYVMRLQARVWDRQQRFEEARSEALRALRCIREARGRE
jgi:tetratricopeptide (TPR) repeat protein